MIWVYRCIGVVLVLYIPIIKYIFDSIICIAVGKNGKENKEGLKTVQLSTIVVTDTLLHDLPVQDSILLDFLVFSSIYLNFLSITYFNILVFQIIFGVIGASVQHQDTTDILLLLYHDTAIYCTIKYVPP